MNTTEKQLLWTRRKMLARVALGSAAGLVLAGCGGGGGGDSTAEKQQALKDAFAALRDLMVWTDVEALVGFPANYLREESSLIWEVGDVELNVVFTSTGTKRIVEAGLTIGNNMPTVRTFAGY